MQEMAPRFSKFSRGWGGACPQTPLANSLASLGRSLAALGRAPRIITLQSIFETWQACHLYAMVLLRVHNICFNEYVMLIPVNKELNGLRKSEVTVERMSVCNVIEKLIEYSIH